MTSTHLAAFSFPLAFDVLRAPEPLAAFRRPEFVSLDADANFDREPDFASSARTAGIPIELLGAVFSFFRTVDRTMSVFEGSSLDFFFPLLVVCGLSEISRDASESELSNSSESSLRGLLLVQVAIGGMRSGDTLFILRNIYTDDTYWCGKHKVCETERITDTIHTELEVTMHHKRHMI